MRKFLFSITLIALTGCLAAQAPWENDKLKVSENGREFTIQMGKIAGEKLNAWWYDTRTGEAHSIGECDNKGSVSFNPPRIEYNGNDWVLVLDNTAREFNPSGNVISHK